MPRPTAIWNRARGVWETEAVSLCGHSEPYSETWPTSGTTRAGRAYARLTSAPLTDGSASSSQPGLLPTPRAREMEESPSSFAARQERLADEGRTKGDSGMPLCVAIRLLPTVRTTDGNGPGHHGTGGQDLRTTVLDLLSTGASTSLLSADGNA